MGKGVDSWTTWSINSRLKSACQVPGTPPGNQLCADLTLRLLAFNSLAYLFNWEGNPPKDPWKVFVETDCAWLNTSTLRTH